MNNEEIYSFFVDAYNIIIMNNYGNGKSLVSTFLNLIMAYYNDREIILSNTPMYNLSSYGIEFVPLISTSQLVDTKNTQMNLDELQTIANSHDSKKPRNSFVTEWSADIRKFNDAICGTCQFGNTIDVRIYNNAEIILIPEFKYKSKNRRDRINFEMYLNIFFKDMGYTDYIEINPVDILEMYNTNFKPLKIVVNHETYLEEMKNKRSLSFYNDYIYECDKEIMRIEKIFKEEMKGKT